MKPLPAFACDIEMNVRSEVTGDADRVLMNPRKLTLPFDETADLTVKACHILHSIDEQIAVHINIEVREV